jgi:hypothetical protein
VLVLVGAGAFAGAAAGGPVPVPPVPPVPQVPPVPTIPVKVPSAPVPLPAIPKLPAPVVTAATPRTPSAVSSMSRSAGSVTSGGATGGSTSAYSGGSSATATGSSGSTAPAARVDHFHSSRPWIGTQGPKRRRTTTFTFVLPAASRVIFTVNQISPACLGVGRFSVAGHAGVNRVRFAGRVHGRQLGPGTYRISIRTAAGAVVRRITLVVVDGSAPTREELRSLRGANTCSSGTREPTSSSTAGGSAASTGSDGDGDGSSSAAELRAQNVPQPLSDAPVQASGVATPHAPDLHSGVLASSVEKTVHAIRPALVALLALSILLLGLASLPRVAAEPRVNDLLARHRLEIAGLGAAALVAVALAFLLA